MTLAAVALFDLGSVAYAQGAGGGSSGRAASGASAAASTGSTTGSTGSSTANSPTSMPGTSGAVGDDKIDRSNRTPVATTR